MSGREWKPGDVVTATVGGRENVRLVAGWSRYQPQLRWCEMSPRWGDGDDDECWFMPSQVNDHRPLVVIDPDDREQVERLVRAYMHEGEQRGHDVYETPDRIDGMQGALREFADPKPPKPDQPLGLGSVIEDNEGRLWVRSDVDAPEWRCSTDPIWDEWAGVSAVCVLSEGWTA
jgi:hypothetical protein